MAYVLREVAESLLSEETLTGELGTRGYVAPEVADRVKPLKCQDGGLYTLVMQRCSLSGPMERSVSWLARAA